MYTKRTIPKMLAIAISLFLALAVTGTGLAAPASSAAAVPMTLSASATTVAPGTDFTVTVSVPAGSQNVDAAQVNLNFDPAILQAISTSPGGTLTTALSGPTIGTGTVDYAAGILGGSTTGTFTLLTVTFRALAPTTSTQISFNATAPRNTDVLYQGASVYSGGSPVSIVVTGSAATAVVPSSGVSLVVVPSVSSIQPGNEFNVNINVQAGSQSVDSVQANVNFNPTYLQVVSVTPGTTLTTTIAGPTVGSGTVDYSAGILGGSTSGTFTVMTIRFKALALNAGTTISFNTGGSRNSDILYSGLSVIAARNGATITIGSTVSTPSPGSGYYYYNIPVFFIIGVNQNSDVTIQTFNFPANQDFTVRMNYYGTLGIGGTIVAYTNSGAGGSFTATYNIPDWLKGQNRIAIRMDSPQGYYSYNWFYNNTAIATPLAPYSGTGVYPTVVPGSTYYSGIPTFSISSAVKDNSVTVQGINFPPNQNFSVKMNYFGTLGIGGTEVAVTNSGAGGSFSATYTIPDWLKGQSQIAIRMDSPQGYYAYNWFYN